MQSGRRVSLDTSDLRSASWNGAEVSPGVVPFWPASPTQSGNATSAHSQFPLATGGRSLSLGVEKHQQGSWGDGQDKMKEELRAAKEKILELTEKYNLLVQEHKGWKREKDQLAEGKESAERRLAERSVALEEKDEILYKLQVNVVALQKEKGGLERQLAGKGRELQEKDNLVQKLEGEVKELFDGEEVRERQVAEMEEVLHEQDKLVKKLEGQVAALEREREEARQTANAELKKENAALNDKVDALKDELEALKTEAGKAQRMAEIARKTLEQAKEQRNEVQEKTKEEIVKLRGEVQILRSESRKDEEGKRGRGTTTRQKDDSKWRELSAELAGALEKLAQARKQIEEDKDAARNLNEQVNEVKKEKDKKITELANQVAALSKSLESRDAAIAEKTKKFRS